MFVFIRQTAFENNQVGRTPNKKLEQLGQVKKKDSDQLLQHRSIYGQHYPERQNSKTHYFCFLTKHQIVSIRPNPNLKMDGYTIRGSSPSGIWGQNDVVLTSMRRNHIASMLIRRHFYAIPRWELYHFLLCLPEFHTGYPDNQRDREQQTLLKSISSHNTCLGTTCQGSV